MRKNELLKAQGIIDQVIAKGSTVDFQVAGALIGQINWALETGTIRHNLTRALAANISDNWSNSLANNRGNME